MGTSVAIPILTLAGLIAATAAFGADTPALSLVFSALFLALAAVVVARDRTRLLAGHVVGLWALFCVLAAVQWALFPHVTVLSGLIVIAAGWACFVLGRAMGATTGGVNRALAMIYGALLLIAVGGFFGFITDPASLWGQAKAFHQDRLTASFLSANSAAAFFTMAAIMAFAGLLRAVGDKATPGEGVFRLADRVGRKALLPLVLLLFALTCLFLTGSRGGVATAAFSLVILFVWERFRGGSFRQLALGVAVVAGLVALLWIVSGGVAQDRLAGLGADSAGRPILWEASLLAWREAPLFGHGLGSFADALVPHITAQNASVLVLQGAAHNLALQWMVQTGLVGTALAAVAMGLVMRVLFVGIFVRKQLKTPLRGIVVVGVAALIHGGIDYALEIPAIFWWTALLMGLGSGISDGGGQTRRREKRKTAR